MSKINPNLDNHEIKVYILSFLKSYNQIADVAKEFLAKFLCYVPPTASYFDVMSICFP